MHKRDENEKELRQAGMQENGECCAPVTDKKEEAKEKQERGKKEEKEKEKQVDEERIRIEEKEGDEKEDKGQGEAERREKSILEELESLKAQLSDKSKQCGEYFDMLQRTAAEYDNYRKRTAREKEALYSEAVSDVIAAFLPVMDNIERAVDACVKKGDDKSIREGIELVKKQFQEILCKLGVEEIRAVGEEFDPEKHHAVMHAEDEKLGKNIVAEEFQKGYIYKDKVIRYSLVKVVN